MNVQGQTFTTSTSHLTRCYTKKKSTSKTSSSSLTKPFNVSLFGEALKLNLGFGQRKEPMAIFLAPEGKSDPNTHKPKKRKVVEHITLVKAKEGLSDEEEKDMLDYCYTTQYQMGGIVAISLGRVSNQNPDNYTHAIFMRFQKKENLSNFYENPFYMGVIKDHVLPYCHDVLNADFESEVEDDILSVFRKGEEFNYGVEFVLLIAFTESSIGGSAEDALASLGNLTMEFPSLIVQATQGSNFNAGSKDFTHVVVIRFRSSEAFKIFVGSSEYKDIWRTKFQPVTQKVIAVDYSVDPVGTEVM